MLVRGIWQSADGIDCRWIWRNILVSVKIWWFDLVLKSLFYFLVKICVCRNQLGLFSLGYIYQLYGTEKDWYTSNTTTLYNFLVIYFPIGHFAIFSFRRVLSTWSRTSHIQATWFTSKFSFYRVNLSFNFRTYRCCFIQIYSKVIEFV